MVVVDSAPEAAEVFCFPRSFRWGLMVAISFFGGMILLALALPYLEPEKSHSLIIVLAIIVFVPLALYGWHVVRMTRDTIAVSKDGLWYLSPGKAPVYVDWRDVAYVRAHDYLQRLTISDVGGQRVIRLEYQLANFERLRETVYSYIPPRAKEEVRRTVFSRSRYIIGVSVAIGLFFGALAVWCILRSEWIPALFFVGFTIIGLAAIIVEPRKLTVEDDSIRMHYLFWNRVIPYSSITNIALKNTKDRGNNVATVVVDRGQAKPLRLAGFREGSLALYDSLKTRWDNARAGGGRPRD